MRIKYAAAYWLFLVLIFAILSCQKETFPITTEGVDFPLLGSDGPYNSERVYYGRNQYIAYYPGDLPIVFSVPHGGADLPAEIPNRTYGTMVNVANTKALTLNIMHVLTAAFGRRPHVIINNLDRKKMDANRDLTEAAQGNLYAERAWEEYQFYIETAKNKVVRDFQQGLFIDIHGHGVNPDGFYDLRIWLGYLLSGTELDQSDTQLENTYFRDKSSIRSLALSSPEDFVSLLRGQNSMGSLLETKGYGSLPSTNSPGPAAMRYFSGGFNTLKHGSTAGGSISAIQLELPKPGIRETATQRNAFAHALVEVLKSYFEIHFAMDLEGLYKE